MERGGAVRGFVRVGGVRERGFGRGWDAGADLVADSEERASRGAHGGWIDGADAAVSDDDGGGEHGYGDYVRGDCVNFVRHHVRLRLCQPGDETAGEFLFPRRRHVRDDAHGEQIGGSSSGISRCPRRARVLRPITLRLEGDSSLQLSAPPHRGIRHARIGVSHRPRRQPSPRVRLSLRYRASRSRHARRARQIRRERQDSDCRSVGRGASELTFIQGHRPRERGAAVPPLGCERRLDGCQTRRAPAMKTTAAWCVSYLVLRNSHVARRAHNIKRRTF